MSEDGSTLVADDVGGLGRVYRYTYQSGSCLVAHTDHPRARFKKTYRPDTWRPRVRDFLEYVRVDLAARGSAPGDVGGALP